MLEPHAVRHKFRIVVTYPIGVRQIGRARDLVSTLTAYTLVRQAEGPRTRVEIVPDSRALRAAEAQIDAKAKQMIAKALGVPSEKVKKVEVDPLPCSCCGQTAAPLDVQVTAGGQPASGPVSPETPPPQRESRLSRRLRRHLMRSGLLQHLVVVSVLPMLALLAAVVHARLAWRRFLGRRPRHDR